MYHIALFTVLLHIVTSSAQLSGVTVGKKCIDSRECQSQNCIKVCTANSNEQVCGAHKWKHQLPRGLYASICYDTILKKTEYFTIDGKDRLTSQQKEIQPVKLQYGKQKKMNVTESALKKPVHSSGLGIGMTCSESKQCKSQKCMKVCSPDSNEQVCALNLNYTAHHCYDSLLKRAKYIKILAPHDAMDTVTLSLSKKKKGKSQLLSNNILEHNTNSLRKKKKDQQKISKRSVEDNTAKEKKQQQIQKQNVTPNPPRKRLVLRILSYYSSPHIFFGQFAHNVLKK